ncbi:hypothetical protein EJ110_NYTH52109 [Nymphaea thermarum]|nr:hypothetical protein EJ110_NYTH52109 [Nymphaea thermarum]
MVKPKEGGNGNSESLLNTLQRKAMREIVTSSISDQGEQVEAIPGCTKKKLVPTTWNGGPKQSSMGSQKGYGQIIEEDNLTRAWGQARSKEGGTDTCLILAPSRTAEGLAESSRVEPTSGVSNSWARRLPPDRLMSLMPGEVSLRRESREQQAAAWRTAKDGRKPKKRLSGEPKIIGFRSKTRKIQRFEEARVLRRCSSPIPVTTEHSGDDSGHQQNQNASSAVFPARWAISGEFDDSGRRVLQSPAVSCASVSQAQRITRICVSRGIDHHRTPPETASFACLRVLKHPNQRQLRSAGALCSGIGFEQAQLTENRSAMDLVLGVYARDEHLRDIVLIPDSDINQGLRVEVRTAGSFTDCDLVFQHPSIHGFHIELEIDKGSRRVWVTNVTLTGKLSVAGYSIKPQQTVRIYPGEVLQVGNSNRSLVLEEIPSSLDQKDGEHDHEQKGGYDSKHQESYVDGSAPPAMQQLCEKIIEAIDRLQAKWNQDEIATGSKVEHDTTAMKEPLLPRSFTPQCMVKPKEGGNGTPESLLNSLQRKAMREIVTSSISDQGEQVEAIPGCTKKKLVPTAWNGGPKQSSMGSQKGYGQIIEEDNLTRAWGQARSKEGGTDTCLILEPSRTAEGLAESSRVEPTSGVSNSWARRLPPDRLMSLMPGEVSLRRESREQQAAAWRTAKDGRKPKKRLSGFDTNRTLGHY